MKGPGFVRAFVAALALTLAGAGLAARAQSSPPKPPAPAAPKPGSAKPAAPKAGGARTPGGTTAKPKADPAAAGWKHLVEGRLKEAEESFAARLAADPSDLSAALGAAALLEQHNDTAGAVRALVRPLAARGVTNAESAGALAALVVLLPRAPDGGASAVPLLRDLLAGRPAPPLPEARGAVAAALASALARGGEPDEAYRVLREEGGQVVHWSVVGPYGRLSRVELDTPFPPEKGDLDPAGDGVAGDGMPRLRVDAAYRDGRLVVPLQFREFGFVYAATDLVTEAPVTVRLVVSSPVSFRVFVNGVPALTADRARSHPPEELAARVTLSPGRHRVLVKLDNGGRFTPLALAVQPAAPGDGGWRSVRNLPVEGDATGKAEARDWPSPLDATPQPAAGSPAAAVAALSWLRLRGLDEAVGEHLRAAVELWPKAPLFGAQLGEWWLNARTGRSAEEDLRLARSLLDAALAADPGALRARLLLARMDESAGQLVEAWQGTSAVLETAPDDPDALALRHRIAQRRSWNVESEQSIERALAAAPGRSDVLDLAIEHYRRAGAVTRLAEAQAEKLRRDPLDDAAVDALTAAGRHEEARAAWERMLALRPTYLYPYLGLARLHADAGRLDEALAALDRAQALFPHEAFLAYRRASLLALAGRGGEAQAELRRSLGLDPSRIELWESLQRRGEPDLLGPWLGSAREILAAAPQPAQGTDSSLLADIAAVMIDARGGQTELYQGIHAVYTRAGVEREGELDVLPGARIQGIRVHKPDGRYADVQPGDKRPVSLPGLEPNDAIEYVWRRYIPPYNALPGALDNRTLFMFQGQDREYVLSRYVVFHPREMPLEVCGNTRGLTTTDEIEGPYRVRSWTAREMPRVDVEPHAADPLEAIPNVRLGLGMTWADIGALGQNSLAGMLNADEPLPELARAIRGRARDGGPRALARALHAVITETMRPGGSALVFGMPASVSASAREGNRSAVALALARELGLDARLLLARPIEQKGRQLDCPSTTNFAYPLVAIAVGPGADDLVILDYNDADFPFDVFPTRVSGADALEIPLQPGRAARLVDLPQRAPGILQESEADLALGADGRVTGRYVLRARGPLGAAMRRVLGEVPPDQKANIYRQIAADTFGGASVTASRVSGEGDPEADLVIDIEIAGGSFARRTPTGFAIPVVADRLAILGRYAALPARTQALLFDAQEFRKDTLTLRLPEGMVAREVPAPATHVEGNAAYSLLVKTDADRVTTTRTALLPPARIEPAAYAAFRALARGIDDAEAREVLVGVTTPSLATPRP